MRLTVEFLQPTTLISLNEINAWISLTDAMREARSDVQYAIGRKKSESGRLVGVGNVKKYLSNFGEM